MDKLKGDRMSYVKNIKVIINLGDKEFTLTTEQTKELRNILNNLLGPEYHYYPYYTYPQIWYSGDWKITSNCGTITYPNGETETFPISDKIEPTVYNINLISK